MRRLAATVLVFAAAGAAINVAVAWASILWSPASWQNRSRPPGWPARAPSWWPDVMTGGSCGAWGWDAVETSSLQLFYDVPPARLMMFRHRAGWPLRSLRALHREARPLPLPGPAGMMISGGPARRDPDNPWMFERRGWVDPPPWLKTSGRPVPIGIIGPAFALNTLVYGGTVWALIAGPYALRRLLRSGRGLCPGCGYPVSGSAPCPECGRPCRSPARRSVMGRAVGVRLL